MLKRFYPIVRNRLSGIASLMKPFQLLFIPVRASLLFTLFLLASDSLFSQNQYFRDYLEFDTIIYPAIDYPLKKYNYEFDYLLSGQNILFISVNEKSNYDFDLEVYDVKNLSKKKSFTLKNSFEEYREPNHTGVLSFDARANLYAILSFNNWQIYKTTKQDTVLINHKKYELGDASNSFQEIKIMNDSVISLSRAYDYSEDKLNEAVSILYYDFKNDREINRINIDTDLPELCFFKPNHHIAYDNDKQYVCDFNRYKVFQVDQQSAKPVVIIEDTINKNIGSIDPLQLGKARLTYRANKNAGALLRLLQPYYSDSILVLTDLYAMNDTVILIRCLKPDSLKKDILNNFIDVWVKDKTSGQFRLKRSLYDPLNYLNLSKNSDTIFNKNSYFKSTATGIFKIAGNKIMFLNWGCDIYPIGQSKKAFMEKEKLFLSEHSAVPIILIYEFKETLYRD